ncbi:MAG TPA: hypothetical protein VGF48_15490 [Thermoanaerobaculia bacterium]|jgi:hypothetical protein
MAEDTVVKEALTEDMKKAGAELTRRLDDAAWPVIASFWYFVPDANQWRLMLASPNLESEGPKQSYEAISKAVSTLREYFDSLEFISVVAPTHDVVQTLASAIQTGRTIDGIRLSKRMVDGHFIDDAYVYRMAPEHAAA